MTIEERMIKAINSNGGKPKLDTPIYFGCLNIEELIHWIGEMEKFFEFDRI